MGMIQEFKDFAIKGNMIDMAVGFIMGGAFGTVVTSLVKDIIMPPVGMLMGGVDFSKLGINLGPGADGKDVMIGYGSFINNVISFLILALCIFLLVKIVNALKKEAEEAPSEPPKQEVLLTEIRDALKK
ncbi:MAG: large-conductance mechanosensitive channel protein MscL [Alphaproteobacteria bacterium]|nr:large-conductance mechanosensitive channel protein MscL [Alphaproteobacteria bacterium]